MRYIQKLEVPKFFIEDVSNLREWSEYQSSKKRELKEYILNQEQGGLCCYCEFRIGIDSSHIEHIKPKSLDVKNLSFDYYNLSVSCQGTCHNKENDNRIYSCGHKKKNEYNKSLFLDPTKEVGISECFEYTEYMGSDSITKVKITESRVDKQRARYMIDILNLNDENIIKKRYLELRKFENIIVELGLSRIEVKEWLDGESLSFISYLKYKYKSIL